MTDPAPDLRPDLAPEETEAARDDRPEDAAGPGEPDAERTDPSLEWPDGPPPGDPSAGVPGNFVDQEQGPQHPDPGLEWPDGPPPPRPARGAERAP